MQLLLIRQMLQCAKRAKRMDGKLPGACACADCTHAVAWPSALHQDLSLADAICKSLFAFPVSHIRHRSTMQEHVGLQEPVSAPEVPILRTACSQTFLGKS